MPIIGYDFFGMEAFKSPSPPVRNINQLEMSKVIIDDIHVRDRTDVEFSTQKQDWQLDTRLLAKFMGDLEAGNISNAGVKIEKFAIMRRTIDEVKDIVIGYKPFINNTEFKYEDYTQTNEEYIYSIVPIGENGLYGAPNQINIQSNFVGFHIVDKDTNETLSFDKFMESEPNVDMTFNQSRTQIDTLSPYPRFIYSGQNYNSFQLQALFLPGEFERTGKQYNRILNKFVNSHRPFLIKGSDGTLIIADISQPQRSVPLNSYKGYDYHTITINCTEIMSVEKYMEG